jgi:outer membrane protein assembly factor BamB
MKKRDSRVSDTMFFLIRILSAVLPVVAGVVPLVAGDWPHWRGPDHNGVSSETGWSDQWPASGPKVAWKTQVGLGFSSFVVARNQAVTMGHADEKDTVFCFAADSGKELWRHSYPSELGDKYFDGGTTGTPTFDGERVFTLSRWGDVFCLNAADGKVLWSKNVQSETGARVPDWGFGGAPLVFGERLILNVGDAGLALDKKTGTIVWKSEPKSAGYSTPLTMKRGNDSFAVFGSGQSYVAVNLKDGKEAWRIRWLTQYGVNAADPIVEGDRIFLSTGYGKGAALFELGGPEPRQIWKSKVLHTQMNAAALYKGHLYGVDGDTTDKASLKCIEFATGTEKWTHAGFGSGGVIIVDGKLVALSGTGELLVAPASSDGFKPASRAQILGGKCWTAPVLANGRIYCRNSRGDVACVDVRKQ